MKNNVSVCQSRSRLFFIGMIFVVLVLMMAACSAPGEQEATAAPTNEAATIAPTQIPVEPTIEPTAEPAEEVGPEPTGQPEVELSSIPQMGALPIVDEVSFEVLGQYGGVASAIAIADGAAYVGFGPRLLVVDVSDPANPQLMGQSLPLADNIRGIAIADGVAYLAVGRAGLVVVDVIDPANLTIVNAGLNYSDAERPSARGIQVDGTMAYLTDLNPMNGEVTLLTFDISNPANVQFGESLTVQANDSLTIDGGRLVIVGNGRIEVRDTADLGNVLGENVLASGDYSSRVVVRDDIAIVVETGIEAGVEIFDISAPQSPTLLSELTPVELFLANRILANETTLFSVGTFGEFGFCESQIDVIDISSLEPVKLSQLQPSSCVIDFALDGEYLYTAGRNGLKIFDVSNPASVEELSLFANPNGFHGAEAVTVKEDVAYLLTGEGGGVEVRLMDISGDTAVPYTDPLVIGGTVILDLILQDDILIAPQWQGGLYLYDLTEATAPEPLYNPDNGNLLTGDIFSMVFNDTVAYVPNADGSQIGGVAVVDLSDPGNPEVIATVETGSPQIMHMVGGNGFLYVLAQGETADIHIIDVSQPLAPMIVGKITMPEYTNRLALSGEMLYAACDMWNCQSFYAIDVSTPDSPTIFGQWAIEIGVVDMIPAGDGLFLLSTVNQGIWLLDVSDPVDPALKGQIQLPGDFVRLKMNEGVVYVAAYDAGLYVLQMH